ncbi:MAG: glucose-1-phosphate cytidylyltransferase [Candidatus Dormibacteraeota bacterium]|nr:glucose-1-phosphate cytidylyltransferase [Candidatus Dormibacteraeota bacterium]
MTAQTSLAGMKVVILCGGLGTRLREETEYRPKPLVPIGNRPILWHIMKTYAAFGATDFVLALGYKGDMIKDFFLNYEAMVSDFTLDLGSKTITRLNSSSAESNWRITFVETGDGTQTGGRLKRLQPYLRSESSFLLTYGDGVSDVDLSSLRRFHERAGCAVVLTGVRPVARFGELSVEGDRVAQFVEKPASGEGWVNGGFFVMTPKVFDYIDADQTILEREPLERLAADRQLGVFKHEGYWQCMDTYRDMVLLNEQWAAGHAPWKRWDDAGRISPAGGTDGIERLRRTA